jgi:hypothetical protein
LQSRAPPVAVRAPHLAFLNLGGHRFPAVRLVHQPVDGLALVRWIHVIKIEQQRVNQTAIHTWMSEKIRPDHRLQRPRMAARALIVARHIFSSI